ncbi:hypothetical protein L1049_000882 [Liquidambar formosana]
MFVGDSLSYNQWESLTCMLHTAVPNSKYTLIQDELLSIFSIPGTLNPHHHACKLHPTWYLNFQPNNCPE